MNRINKSTTKFVPKRKNQPLSSSSTTGRANSTTPSVAGTPKVNAYRGSLQPVEEFDLNQGVAAGGFQSRNNVEEEEGNDFVAPLPPTAKGFRPRNVSSTVTAPSLTSIPPASSKSQQSQRALTPPLPTPASSSTSRAPAATFNLESTSSQPANLAKGKGTAFGISSTGPSAPPRKPIAPPFALPPTPAATAVSLSTKAPTKKAVVVVEAASDGDEDEEEEVEPRTQREIEAEALQAKAAKKANQEKSKLERERKKAAKTAAKGKGKEVVDGNVVTPVVKKRVPKKAQGMANGSDIQSNTPQDDDAFENGVSAPKKRKRAASQKVPTNEVDRMILGFDDVDAPDDAEEASNDGDSGGDSDDEDGGAQQKAKRKKVEKTPGKERLEPVRIDVDPETTTMADLSTSKDILSGRVSKKGIQLAQKVAKDNSMRRKSLKEKTRIMRERAERRRNGDISEPGEDSGDDNDAAAKKEEARTPRLESPAHLGLINAAIESEALAAESEADGLRKDSEDEEGGDGDDEDAEGLTETQYAPQMRIVDGNLVVDEASLEVDRSLDARLGHVGPREVIEESASDRMVNSASWRKKKRTATWTIEETNYFYECIRQFGTDFEMIAALFPGRERSEIKRKFNKEDRNGNEQRLTDAIMQRSAIDLDLYAKLTGNDFSGPIPDDPLEAIRIRREAAEQVERVKAANTPAAVGGPGKKNAAKPAAIAPIAEEEEEEEEEDDDEAIEAERLKQIAIDEALEKELQAEKKKGKKTAKK